MKKDFANPAASTSAGNLPGEEKTAREGKGAVAYIGPAFYGVIERNTVYAKHLPEKFELLAEQHSFLKGLIVPVRELSKAKKELRMTSSEKAMLYEKAMQIGGKNV